MSLKYDARLFVFETGPAGPVAQVSHRARVREELLVSPVSEILRPLRAAGALLRATPRPSVLFLKTDSLLPSTGRRFAERSVSFTAESGGSSARTTRCSAEGKLEACFMKQSEPDRLPVPPVLWKIPRRLPGD